VGAHTRELLCSWYPAPLRPLVRRAVHALLTDRMLAAFGFPAAPPWLRRAVSVALRARSAVVRVPPPRRVSRPARDPRNRTYPGCPRGYRPSDLGVPPPGT
jgi:hypothetical protein